MSLPPQYIVLFVAKVLMGQMQEVNDVREYDVEDSKKTTTAKKKEAGLQLPRALKEGYVGGTHTHVQQRPPAPPGPWSCSQRVTGAGCFDTEQKPLLVSAGSPCLGVVVCLSTFLPRESSPCSLCRTGSLREAALPEQHLHVVSTKPGETLGPTERLGLGGLGEPVQTSPASAVVCERKGGGGGGGGARLTARSALSQDAPEERTCERQAVVRAARLPQPGWSWGLTQEPAPKPSKRKAQGELYPPTPLSPARGRGRDATGRIWSLLGLACDPTLMRFL